jgi:hypothetical protein
MRHSTCLAAALLFWTLQTSAAPVEYPARGGGDEDVKTPKVDLGNQVWTEPLLGFGVKTKDAYTDGNLFLVVPLWSTLGRNDSLGGDYIFMEPYTSVGEGGEVTTSLGLSWRHLFSHESMSALQKQGQAGFMEEGWFIGANVFLDMLDTQHNNNFWQMGVGAEVGSRYLELRGNYYIPMTGEKLYDRQVHTQTFTSSSSSTVYNSVTNYGDPYATGNSIAQPASTQNFATTSTATTTTTVRTVTQLFEKGMEGWDTEASFLVPWLDQWMDLRLIGGYFSFNNQPFGPQDGPTGPVHGWKAGAELRPVPAVVLGSMWYEDKRFAGGNWIVSAQLQIPMDKTWKNAFQMRRRHLVEHLAEPVHRQNDAIKVGNREDDQTNISSSTSVKHVTRVVSQSSTRLVLKDDIIFVNNGGAVGNGIQAGSSTGDGTAQHPVNAIQTGADIAATNNNNTGRVWNVYTQQSSAGAYVENIAVKGSTNFVSSGILIPVMGGKTFGTGVKPTLQGGFGTGTTGYSFVGLSGYNVSANFDGYPAISFRNVQNGVIASNTITNPAGTGIEVTAGDGHVSTVLILNNLIDQTTLCGCCNAVQIGAFEKDSVLNVVFNNNQITNTNGSGINGAAAAGGKLYLSAANNTITGAGRDGITLQSLLGGSLVAANLTGNTVTNSGSFAEPESPEGSGISLTVRGDARANLTLTSNDLSHNLSNGLFVIADDESQGTITGSGNNFSGNGAGGAFLVSNSESRLKVSFSNDHFDSNDVGLLVNVDGHSALSFNAVNSTFVANQGPGVHIESHDGSSVFPSIISGALILENGGPALELSTTENAILALAVKDSTITTASDVGILAKLGDGDLSGTPGVNLLLTIANTSIYSTGKGATGIDFVSSGTGIGALLMDSVNLTVDSPTAIGIRLTASGTAVTGPNVAALITNSTVNVSGGPGIELTALNDGGVAVNMANTTIHSDEDGISIFTQDNATALVSVTGATTITSTAVNAITATASDNSFLSLNVQDSTLNAFHSGVYLTENIGATLNATVNGNTITPDISNPTPLDSGIVFYKNGGSATVDFNDNVISGGGQGIYLSNSGTSDITANLNGNTTSNNTYGIYYQHGAGTADLNLNSNNITSFTGAGIFLYMTAGSVAVNPIVTPVSNAIDVGPPPSLGVLNLGAGTLTGTIIINGTSLNPPSSF